MTAEAATGERLQNILSHRGVASRRAAAALIEEGRVTVDGAVVREPGARFDPSAAVIAVDGRELSAQREATRTILMYKPAGILSSVSDPFGGKTVIDLLRAEGTVPERLVPVGRLDKDSEGLLLLSNDGDLTLRLTHPRYEHEKTYIVRAAGRWSEDKLRILRGPVAMPDGYVTKPVPVELIRTGRDNVHVLCFKLREGRKRQIRYMCSAAHLVVLSLKRVAIGALRLPEDLEPGRWRDLTPDEIVRLGQRDTTFDAPVRSSAPHGRGGPSVASVAIPRTAANSPVRKLTGKPRADTVWSALLAIGLTLWTTVAAALDAGFARLPEVSALAMADGTNRTVVLALDGAVAVSAHDRQALAEATHLPPEAILLHAPRTGTVPADKEALGTRLATAVTAALADLAPATVTVTRGRIVSDVLTAVGETNDTVRVMRFNRPGRPTVVGVAYPGNPVDAADLPRHVRETTEGVLDNTRCIFFCGPSAPVESDASSVSAAGEPSVSLADRERFGRRLGRIIAGVVLSRWTRSRPLSVTNLETVRDELLGFRFL